MKKAFSRGVSLVEIIVVIALIGIITTIISTSISGKTNTYNLERTAGGVMSLLEKAQSRSAHSYNNTSYSVKIESDQAILFQGSSYSSSDPSNEIYPYENNISLATTSLEGGATTVTFNKVTGKTSQYGSIRLGVINSSTSSSTIFIGQTGIIYR